MDALEVRNLLFNILWIFLDIYDDLDDAIDFREDSYVDSAIEKLDNLRELQIIREERIKELEKLFEKFRYYNDIEDEKEREKKLDEVYKEIVLIQSDIILEALYEYFEEKSKQ